MDLPDDILLEILNFLPEEDLEKFPRLLPTHTRLRNATSAIHSPGDLYRARQFPNSRLALYVYHSRLYSYLEPEEYPRVTKLFTSRYIPALFQNLTTLNISHSNITSLPLDFTQLTELNCSYSLVEEIPECYSNLISLDISHTLITELPQTLLKLEKLNAYNTLLTELSPALTKLKELDIGQTIIRELPHTYTELKKLDCRMAEVLLIPETYTKLERLDCQFTHAEIPENIRMLPMRFFREKAIYQINFYLRKR